MNSTHFLREGRSRAILTWKPGHFPSPSIWHPLVRYLSRLRSAGMWIFWEMTSGSSACSILRGSTLGTCSCQSTETFQQFAVFLHEGGHRIFRSCSVLLVRLRSTGNWILFSFFLYVWFDSGYVWICWEMTSGNCLRMTLGFLPASDYGAF